MQIYGPSQDIYDIDLGPVMLSDWVRLAKAMPVYHMLTLNMQYHAPYTEIVADVLGTDYSKLPPMSNSGLINGRGRFDCSLLPPGTPCNAENEYSVFRFQSNKIHRLRLMNHGADGKLARSTAIEVNVD